MDALRPTLPYTFARRHGVLLLGDGVGVGASEGADALVIATEWQEFRSPHFDRLKAGLQEPAIFGGRNLYDPQLLARGMVVEAKGLCHAGPAVRLGGMPEMPAAPAPARAGADTDAILEALGVDAGDRARLRGAGVI